MRERTRGVLEHQLTRVEGQIRYEDEEIRNLERQLTSAREVRNDLKTAAADLRADLAEE